MSEENYLSQEQVDVFKEFLMSLSTAEREEAYAGIARRNLSLDPHSIAINRCPMNAAPRFHAATKQAKDTDGRAVNKYILSRDLARAKHKNFVDEVCYKQRHPYDGKK